MKKANFPISFLQKCFNFTNSSKTRFRARKCYSELSNYYCKAVSHCSSLSHSNKAMCKFNRFFNAISEKSTSFFYSFPGNPHKNSCLFKNHTRGFRAGFFKTDKDFIDPEDVLLCSDAHEWRHADDGTLKNPILERNNCGMGMLIINDRNEGKRIRLINSLYRKLRDLEVNSLKRFVALTSFSSTLFCRGPDLKDLLLFAESSQLLGFTQNAAMKYIKNENDLSWCIYTYFKPLISLLNGPTFDSGVVLSCLSNRSAAYTQSEFSCVSPSYGWFPNGGLSYVLSRLRGSLGVYLALTGHTLKGVDLVFCGICSHWMSSDALHFLEVTSEKQLEVSEHDAKILLEEHFLDFRKAESQEYSLHSWESVIFDFFNKSTLSEVIDGLKRAACSLGDGGVDRRKASSGGGDRRKASSGGGDLRKASNDGEVALWASNTLKMILALPPISAHVTFRLIKELQNYRYKLLNASEVTHYEYNGMLRLQYRQSKTPKEESMKQLLEAIDEECLFLALTLETRIAYRMLMNPDLLEALRAYLTRDSENYYSPTWKASSSSTIVQDEISKFFFPLEDSSLEFNVVDRHEFPLSSYPKIRKLHSNYNPITKLDYDPSFMDRETIRWRDDYLDSDMKSLEKLLIDSPIVKERAKKAAKSLGII